MTNSHTFDEQRRRLEALRNAGVIDQAAFQKRIDALQRAPSASPPAASANRNAGPPRADNSRLISAPYRFVPIAEKWVVVDATTIHALDEPAENGWEAEIEFEIEAESPLLIGEESSSGDKKADVVPMALPGGRNGFDWIIPGSTLRGWLRSEMEIVAFARLAQFNRNRAFPLRDFNHKNFGEGAFPVGRVDDVKAGWLRRRPRITRPEGLRTTAGETSGDILSDYEIIVCPRWYVVDAGGLAEAMRLRPNEDLTRLPLMEKYDLAAMVGRPQEPAKKWRVLNVEAMLQETIVEMVDDGTINGKPALAVKDRHNAGRTPGPRGHFVFSGRSPSGKGLEYWFDASDWTHSDPDDHWSRFDKITLTRRQWDRFEDLNSNIVGDKRKPQGNWEELAATLEYGKPIPIFFVGDPETVDEEVPPGQPRFAFGLTRLFKVPHENDLGKLVERSGHARPDLLAPEARGKSSRVPVDFVDNLFGYVYEPEDWGLGKTAAKAAPPRDFARRGRIAIGAARMVGPTEVKKREASATVMAAAKPSFAPFYLVGPIKDYSDPDAKIAGRKVYPPRFDAEAVKKNLTTAEVERLLKRQVEAIERASTTGKAVSANLLSHLAFLDPGNEGSRPRFRSTIRLHNVTAEEIGAVLWVLTHGGRSDLRHMIGRAKAFGAGQVRVTVTGLTAERLGLAGGRLDTADRSREGEFRQAFVDFMNGAVEKLGLPGVASWETSPTIRGWLALRDPAKGARMAREKKLDTMPLKQFEPGVRPFNPYQMIRDMTKPLKDGNRPVGPDRFLDYPRD